MSCASQNSVPRARLAKRCDDPPLPICLLCNDEFPVAPNSRKSGDSAPLVVDKFEGIVQRRDKVTEGRASLRTLFAPPCRPGKTAESCLVDKVVGTRRAGRARSCCSPLLKNDIPFDSSAASPSPLSVSYTHLTLPTIYSV